MAASDHVENWRVLVEVFNNEGELNGKRKIQEKLSCNLIGKYPTGTPSKTGVKINTFSNFENNQSALVVFEKNLIRQFKRE